MMGLAYLEQAGRTGAWGVACALLCAVLVPLPAAAQQQASALGLAEIVDSATIRSIGDLDFGNILPSGNGTVVVPPSASPTCTVTGALVRTGPCVAAVFTGTAFYQADLRVMRPSGNSITLTGPGGATMVVDTFTFDSPGPTVYIGPPGNSPNQRFTIGAADGSYTFYVGGTLHVAAIQMPGVYSGSFQLRVSYN